MRILYIDVDSQRPDHLGCYGYHRDTSPNIDRIAAQGVRFQNCHVSDAPCLPSRTALWSGRHGIHTGVINHGGEQADPFKEGLRRGFRSVLGGTNWMSCLRQTGHKTATISPFGERHSAWHWYAGFNEIFNTGKGGMESAVEVSPVAIDWLQKNARADNWFLHLNFWDPHTPYRVPAEYGDPFQNDPLPAWLTEEVRRQHCAGIGPHSAQEIPGWSDRENPRFPRQPVRADSMDAVRAMFDGYDTGTRYADEHIGRVLNTLADQGVLEETVIVISADHGENLGELNIYGDHQTADQITTRVPLIVRWPGITDNQAGRVDLGLLYHFDFAATMIELTGGAVPILWDGRSFAEDFQAGQSGGRPYLVVSQGAWSCQRSVRFRRDDTDYICIRSYHDGYHGFPDIMLFDLTNDPHEQHDIAPEKPELVREAMLLLDEWMGDMMQTATHPIDPMRVVLNEGGPLHTRGELPAYLQRLRETGRGEGADKLAAMHPAEARPLGV
ncbi:MAG: sulfatase [Armatimonadaceae bacterium]